MSKYHNIRTNGFDSKKEAGRYQELKLLEKAGVIMALELQPRFLLQDSFSDKKGIKYRKIEYVADFKYFDKEMNCAVVEDVKGMKTEVYKLKKKLFLKQYPDYIFIEVSG